MITINEKKQEVPPDHVNAKGVGLKQSEWDDFNKIADELNTNVHALILYILRDFKKRYLAGEIKTVTKKTLPGL
jgi:hypothetical protein